MFDVYSASFQSLNISRFETAGVGDKRGPAPWKFSRFPVILAVRLGKYSAQNEVKVQPEQVLTLKLLGEHLQSVLRDSSSYLNYSSELKHTLLAISQTPASLIAKIQRKTLPIIPPLLGLLRPKIPKHLHEYLFPTKFLLITHHKPPLLFRRRQIFQAKRSHSNLVSAVCIPRASKRAVETSQSRSELR